LTASCISGCGRMSAEESLPQRLAAQSAISTYPESFRKLSVHFHTSAGNNPLANAPTPLHVCRFQAIVASWGNGDGKCRV